MLYNASIEKTLNLYNSLDVLPHSLLIIGPEGSGKHTLCKKLSDNLNQPLLDITEYISDEYFDELYRKSLVAFYLIDLNELTEKKQNVLLKIFEEPPSTAYFFIISTSRSNILKTIENRGVIISIERYTKESLSKLIENEHIDIPEEYIGSVLMTPGDIYKVNQNNINIKAIEELCVKINTSLDKASYPNTLSIADKINFKDEYDKLDLNFFLRLLYFTLVQNYISTHDNRHLKYLEQVDKALKTMQDQRINQKLCIINMLTAMWRINRDGYC